jgi:hypothetical protein
MLLILRPDIDPASSDYQQMLAHLHKLPDIRLQTHQIQGQQQTLTEIYLLGNTARLDRAEIESLAAVERVVRISDEYRILGRHRDRDRVSGFHYNGVDFSQEGFQLFAGLCAVDNRRNVETMMKALHEHGLECTRMGAYKPRTSPYAFQGHGADCLPDLFELAGKYGIKVIAMEVTHEAQVEEIDQTLERLGRPTRRCSASPARARPTPSPTSSPPCSARRSCSRHNKTLAAQLYGEFREFFPDNAVEYFVSYYDYYQPEAYVPSSDTYIEKDASINEHIEQMRLSATKALLERRTRSSSRRCRRSTASAIPRPISRWCCT